MQVQLGKRRISTLIFDLDGVLTDSFFDVADAVNEALKALGVPPKSYEFIRKYFNNGDRNIMVKVLGAEQAQLVEKALAFYLTIYEQNGFPKTRLFPGVKEVLAYYQSQNLAVLTNKVDKLARLHLEKLGIASCFQIIAGAESVTRLKPEPDGILGLIEKLGAVKEETIMIGDAVTDVQAGKAAGVLTCALSGGYTEAAVLAQAEPDFMLDSLHELIEVCPLKM